MDYKYYMKKCLELAQKASGETSPNPLVGCVVLDKNGNEISCGYHKFYGSLHAEAEALSHVGRNAEGGTLIVNLEPCNHHGKTPPCSELIIKKGIKKIVVAMEDPNHIAKGGIEKCKEAGIEVLLGVLEEEAKELNEIFLKNVQENKIFVSIKVATTIDGKIATKTGDSKWITSESAREEVQNIRKMHDAILTTSDTVIADNPSMTYRGLSCKNVSKIILDRELKTDFDAKIYDSKGETIYIVVGENISEEKIKKVPDFIKLIYCPVCENKLDLNSVFEQLYLQGIRSVLVEAGGKLNGELISKGLVDKIYHFVAPKILSDNSAISAFSGRDIEKISDTLNFKLSALQVYPPDYLAVYRRI